MIQQCRQLLILLAITLSGMGLANSRPACAAEGKFDRTLQVTGPVDLDVHTGSGNIDVRAGDASTVRVHGTIRANDRWSGGGGEVEKEIRYLESNPPIEQHDNIIKIGQLEDRELERHISISYEILTPVETRLRAGTGSGNQVIDGLKGPLEASTGSGNLKVSNLGDQVRVSTGSGGIQIETVKGDLHASTGSGTIRASGVAGGLRASTGSGDITLEQAAPGDVEVNTGSGNVNLRGVHGEVRAQTASGSIHVEGEGSGSWRLGTASGGVTIRLPAQQGFTLHARTVSGHIDTAREMVVQAHSKREITGKVGDGGFSLDVSTVSGNIRID
jgi:putative adhesin